VAAEVIDALAERVRDLGAEAGLPYVAASADISSTEPLRDPRGRPFAEDLFCWVDPDLQYWKDRGFALHAPFVAALRYACEPFFYHAGRLRSWRPSPRLARIDVEEAALAHGVGAAIIAPVHLPGGVVGGVVWAGPTPRPDMPELYARWAAELHTAAIRFIAACYDNTGCSLEPARLTRREVQCLKWAAAGKTDQEIAQIIRISVPTVRFHLRNAAEKLGGAGRAQAVHRAAALGYIGVLRGAAPTPAHGQDAGP
jgi:DNA-binding CsgD family transcriptional regulator